MSNEQTHHEGGFWGGITLVSIIWGILVFCAFAVAFCFVYFLLVFTVYAIWYYSAKLSGCPEKLQQCYDPGTKTVREIVVEDNPADIMKVFHFFASIIYSVVGFIVFALLVASCLKVFFDVDVTSCFNMS